MPEAQFESRSPQQPSDVVATFTEPGPADVAARVAAARRAQPTWARTPPVERATVIDRAATSIQANAAELVDLVVREVGKPRVEAVGEVDRAVAILRYFAQQVLDPDGETYPSADGRAMLFVRRRPRGVVGLVTPWNFPVAIPAWKLAPALACGNSVVVKPAPQGAASSERFLSLLGDALPEGVLTSVVGGGRVGGQLVSLVDAVSFTGSTAVGRQIAVDLAPLGTPYQAEMGGQNPSIVLPDANVDHAAATIAGAAMYFAGQKCTATSRVVVVGRNRPFLDALVDRVSAIDVGDPDRSDCLCGPVIDEAARTNVVTAIADAVGHGARLLCGSATPPTGAGWYVRPTVVETDDPAAPLAQEEVFGPLCSVLHADTVEQAVQIANGTRYGLSSSIFTTDLGSVLRHLDQLQSGMIRVNAATSGVDFFAPFGGERDSNRGPREQGRAARDFFTTTATYTVAPAG